MPAYYFVVVAVLVRGLAILQLCFLNFFRRKKSRKRIILNYSLLAAMLDIAVAAPGLITFLNGVKGGVAGGAAAAICLQPLVSEQSLRAPPLAWVQLFQTAGGGGVTRRWNASPHTTLLV